MPRIEGIPLPLQVNLKPSTKVHRIRDGRHSYVPQIAGCVLGWNIQAPAERNCQVREVSPNPDLLPKSFECSTIGTSLLIIEAEMAMDKVANRLNPFPSGSYLSKGTPSKIYKFAVDLAISTRQ